MKELKHVFAVRANTVKTTSCSSNCQIKSFFTPPSLFWHLNMQLCAPKDGGFALLASSSSLRFMYILWTQHVNMFTYICMYIYLYVKPQRLRRASRFLRDSYCFTQQLTPALSTSDSKVVSFSIDLSFQARNDYSVITEGKNSETEGSSDYFSSLNSKLSSPETWRNPSTILSKGLQYVPEHKHQS